MEKSEGLLQTRQRFGNERQIFARVSSCSKRFLRLRRELDRLLRNVRNC
jgi:hypothetical protein